MNMAKRESLNQAPRSERDFGAMPSPHMSGELPSMTVFGGVVSAWAEARQRQAAMMARNGHLFMSLRGCDCMWCFVSVFLADCGGAIRFNGFRFVP